MSRSPPPSWAGGGPSREREAAAAALHPRLPSETRNRGDPRSVAEPFPEASRSNPHGISPPEAIDKPGRERRSPRQPNKSSSARMASRGNPFPEPYSPVSRRDSDYSQQLPCLDRARSAASAPRSTLYIDREQQNA